MTSFVAIPDGCDRIHDRVARARVRRKAEQHAYAEIEAVQQDIKEHTETENQGPDRHQVENLVHRTSPFAALAAPSKIGTADCWPTTGFCRARPDSCSPADRGPPRIRRSISRRPVG